MAENKEIAPKGRFQQALERLRPFVKEKVVGAGQAVAAAARAANEWYLGKVIKGELPNFIPTGATAEEWRGLKGLKGEAGKLVTDYRTETESDRKREAAKKLAELITKHEKKKDWNSKALSAARKALTYMGEEIEEADKGKQPVPPPSVEQEKGPQIIGEEEVETEGGASRFKRYKFKNIDEVGSVVRDWLDNTKVLGDAPIHPLENTYIYENWLGAAKQFVAKETDENKKKKLEETHSELVMEYESVRRALDWWHHAAREPHKANEPGGFSKGKDTFNAGIGLGNEYSGEYIYWLINSSHRGESFIKGFAAPRADFKNTQFKNASEYLGSQLRSSCGIGTKDPNNPKDPDASSFPFVDSDGNKIPVVNARNETIDKTKPTNGFMYEIHKQVGMDGYSYKYLRVRHKMMDSAFEPIPDPEDPQKILGYKCHISADRLWAYDAFQHPKHMDDFWFANLDILNSAETNALDIPEGQRGRDFLEQLGWQEDLDPDPEINIQLNKIRMGKGQEFMSDRVPLDLKQRLCRRLLGLNWDENWSDKQKHEMLEKLGMVDMFGDIPYGINDNYYLLTNVIKLDTEKIPLEIWQKLDWSPLKKIGGALLGDWCQQQVYLQKLRNEIINILSGGSEEKSLLKSLEFIKSSEAFRHIADVIAPVAEREKSWWWEGVSDQLMLTSFGNRMKGQRIDEVAVPINQLLREGLYMGTYAQEFEDAGLPGHNWSDLYEHPVREIEGRVAKTLAKFNNSDVWDNYMDDILKNTEFANLTKEEKYIALVSFAGFKIDKVYFQLRERIERNVAEVGQPANWRIEQKGRVVRYFEFSLDGKREWGEEKLQGKLGTNSFKDLMDVMEKRILDNGWFNRFYEKMDEEEIVCKLIDSWLDKVYNGDKENLLDRDWGLPMSWYKREIIFNQTLRDMKYAIGGFKGQWVLEQLAVDKDERGRPLKVVRDEDTGLEAYNLRLEPNEVKDLKGKRISVVYQPVFPMFRPNLRACQGKDKVWSMLQGTGEWFPGMAKRLTPLYIHYNRDRYMNLFITMFFDPLFRRKAFENAGKDWEEDLGFLYVANPLKQRQMMEIIDQAESDPDWAQQWRAKLQIISAQIMNDFVRERREIRVLNYEKGQFLPAASEEDILAVSQFTGGVFKLLEPTGILSNRIVGGIFGKTGKEVGQRVIAMLPGAAASFTIFGLPILAAPLLPEAGGLAIALRLITTGIFTAGGGLISNAVLSGDAGIDPETGWEKDAYERGFLGTIRRVWKTQNIGVPFSLMAARIDARSYEQLIRGKRPLWDDLLPADKLVNVFFVNPKTKLQHYQQK